VVAAAIAWTLHLGAAPDPFAAASGLMLAAGLVVFSLVDATGLLLSRGRWSRRLGLALAAAGGGIFVGTDGSLVGGVAVLLSGAALLGLTGPWLDGWIRQRPAAEGPGPWPLGVVFGSLALLPAVGIAAPARLTAWHLLLGLSGIALAWGYGRAQLWGLWAIRLGLPLLALPAVLAGPLAGGLLLVALVAGIVVASWTRHARLAVVPLLDRLPGPRIGSAGRPAGSADG
jgi:hypothetical protein